MKISANNAVVKICVKFIILARCTALIIFVDSTRL